VISAVKSLQSSHSGYSVKVTGHSLGAALAQLTSMDLLKNGISNTVYDFGQPRTGDKTYSTFSTSRVPTFRVVHNKDQVPHLPFTTQMDFYHVCTEQFEDASGKLKTCDSSCEDPTCGDQYAFAQTNWDDHSYYLGMHVSCSSV
jgi:predicted lipase